MFGDTANYVFAEKTVLLRPVIGNPALLKDFGFNRIQVKSYPLTNSNRSGERALPKRPGA